MANSVENEARDETLEYLIRQYRDAADSSQNARADAETYRDYYDGRQWSSEELSVLEKRKQPAITDNRIKDKIEFLLGFERQTRTDPKAYPRNPQDEDSAEAATDALRFIADNNDFEQVKSAVFENMLVEGFGGCEVIAEAGAKDTRIAVRHIRWDRLYYDPHSLAPDFRDAQFMGVVVWMDAGRAKAKYPEMADAFDGLLGGSTFDVGDTYDDKPTIWVDRVRRRIQILEHYYRDGNGWNRAVFSRAGWIEKPAPSKYLDEEGNPVCPIVMQSLYVAREGARYGLVARYKDLQDEINKRRSKALHILSTRQALTEAGAVENVEKLRKELARPDGIVEIAPGMQFSLLETRSMADGQFQLLMEALNALSATGPNEALQGQANNASGRAQQIAQEGGAVQLGIMFDSVRYFQKRVMEAAWNRVRQFWTSEKWIRITEEDKSKFVALNQPMTAGELEAERLKNENIPDEEKLQRIQALAQDPMAQQQVVKNPVAELEVDIIIDHAPDTVTLQQEQWGQLVELAKNGFPIPPDVLLQASGLRNKKELIDKMMGGGEEGQQPAGPPPELMQQIQETQQQLQQGAAQLQQKEQELREMESKLREEMSDLERMKTDISAERRVFAAEQKAARATLTAVANRSSEGQRGASTR